MRRGFLIRWLVVLAATGCPGSSRETVDPSLSGGEAGDDGGDDGGATSTTSGGSEGPVDDDADADDTAGSTTSADGTTSTGAAGSSEDDAPTDTSDGGSSSDGDDGSSTGAPDPAIGCADGEREGFLDLDVYLDIAGCSGAWSTPGILNTTEPGCGHQGGDDSEDSDGIGCTVADLCAPGWHVCDSAAEVDDLSPNGCVGATEDAAGNLFFATRQSGPGSQDCGVGTNDFFGCGNVGAANVGASCAPLDRYSNNLCTSLPAPWTCPGNGTNEANQVTKPTTLTGGVLCCRDG